MSIVSSTAYATAGDAMQLVRSLLADLDTPGEASITPTGAVRASDVVTITTQEEHGIQIGDVVYIAGTTNASFAGTFTVVTVPTTFTFTYFQTAADASTGQGTVNIANQGDVFKDSVLLPMVNQAYRKVSTRLMDGGSKTTTKVTEYAAVEVGFDELSDTSAPQLPADFLAPREIWEKVAGDTTFYGPPMLFVNDLPSGPQGAFNRVASWREDGIFFNGATQILDLKLRYIGGFAALGSADSQILIRGGLDAVANFTAARAARSRGSNLYQALTIDAEECMKELLTLQVHARQYQPARRRPYRNGGINVRGFFR